MTKQANKPTTNSSLQPPPRDAAKGPSLDYADRDEKEEEEEAAAEEDEEGREIVAEKSARSEGVEGAELVETKASGEPPSSLFNSVPPAAQAIDYDNPNYEDDGISGSAASNRLRLLVYGNPNGNNSETMDRQLNQETDHGERGEEAAIATRSSSHDDYVFDGFGSTAEQEKTTVALDEEMAWGGVDLLPEEDSAAKTVKSRRRRNNHRHTNSEEKEVAAQRTRPQLMARERDSGEWLGD